MNKCSYIISLGWRANIDISFILDNFRCNYICKYVNKPEK